MKAIVGSLLALTLFFVVNIAAAYKVGDAHKCSLAANATGKPDPWRPVLRPRSPVYIPTAAKPAEPKVVNRPRSPVYVPKPAEPKVVKQQADSLEAKEARALFNSRCVTCHGASGRGDGAVGKALKPTPRDYTDKAWQKSVTDEHIAKVIVQGGPAVGKSPLMPPNPDLASKKAVLRALVKIVRDFGESDFGESDFGE